MMSFHFLFNVVVAVSWLIALNWAYRVANALRNLPAVPDLLSPIYTATPPTGEAAAHTAICVIVPACNEEATIGETLQTLRASKGVEMEIIAIDDRSTDATGAIMDQVAAMSGAHPLRVIHLTELPNGWLGKPHAMALAARQTSAEWLLFTDGDVLFDPDLLRRTLQLMDGQGGDHLTFYPTLILKSFGERLLMCSIQVLAIWMVRPWKIADPKAVKDSMGIGAFNLVRREVYQAVGGYESLRMEVLDDLRLGYKIKHAGYQQRVAFGRNLLRIRWGVGVRGLLHNMTKNAFAVFSYRVPMLLGACCGLSVLCLLPLLPALFLLHAGGQARAVLQLGPFVIQIGALLLLARHYQRHSGIPPAFVIGFPVGVSLLIYAMVRSMVVTLRRGGVPWRGTLYSLSELRRHVGPVR